MLWARAAEVVAAINADHANPAYLPGVALSPAIAATGDLAGAGRLRRAGCSSRPRSICARVWPACPSTDAPLILCAKGIEAGTRLLMSELAAELRPGAPIAVLSGPTFAHEVAAGLPTAVTLACADEALGATLAAAARAAGFRPYRSDDVLGAEIGGAVKNVLAIACGVVAGRGLGQNAARALIARGFAEMVRFGRARGARAETLAGPVGPGRSGADLLVDQLAQLFARARPRPRRERRDRCSRTAAPSPRARRPRRCWPRRRARCGVEMPIAEAVRDLLAGRRRRCDVVRCGAAARWRARSAAEAR